MMGRALVTPKRRKKKRKEKQARLTLKRTRPDQKGAPQTLGAALKSILPSLFPSSRDPVLANVIMHGGAVPFRAPLEELMREAAYPDGWLCLCVVLL